MRGKQGTEKIKPLIPSYIKIIQLYSYNLFVLKKKGTNTIKSKKNSNRDAFPFLSL